MFPRRPGRIRGFDYIGLHRYSVTVCTHQRNPVFISVEAIQPVMTTIRQCAATFGFAIHAYCFMSDHVHLVLAASDEQADLQRFMSNWKQRSGYRYKRQTGRLLWQESYHDHVLRNDEETDRIVRYVLENPVRAGLVAEFDQYPFSGSDEYSKTQLKVFWERQR